jgi:hypothetical protein
MFAFIAAKSRISSTQFLIPSGSTDRRRCDRAVATGREPRVGVCMISRRLPVRQLPVVLPPLADELLSSWINRHAVFYGVTGGHLLRHYSLEAATLREHDLNLTSCDQPIAANLGHCRSEFLNSNSSTVLLTPHPPSFVFSCASSCELTNRDRCVAAAIGQQDDDPLFP